MTKASTRGGARPGAGRKAQGLVVHTFRMRETDRDFIRQLAEETGASQSDIVHELIESFKESYEEGA